MTNYVIINGVNSNTINGLGINELPPITKPQMRTMQEEIDGRDGDITTNLGYSAYDKTITIGLFGTGYDINDIVAFFNGEGTIVFSNEADKYYNFKILNQIDYVALQKFKSASITFHCQPFKYPLTETPLEIEYSYIEDEGESLTLNNTGEATLKLDLLGNTSQTGTPTPSTPINVNVVSGDNSINVCGKNLLEINSLSGTMTAGVNYTFNNSEMVLNGTATSGGALVGIGKIFQKSNTTYTFTYLYDSGTCTDYGAGLFLSDTPTGTTNIGGGAGFRTSQGRNMTLNTSTSDRWLYLYLNMNNNSTYTNYKLKLQIEEGTATTYEEYTGKSYPVNLPVENLFDKGNVNVLNAYLNVDNGKITNSDTNRTIYISCKPNTTYTLTKYASPQIRQLGYTTELPANNVNFYGKVDIPANGTTGTITTGANAKYLICRIINTYQDTITQQQMLDSIQIEVGSKANSYTQFGTTPIELCKIGDYQDYFTKNNGKNLFDKNTPSTIATTATWTPTTTGGKFTNTGTWGTGVRWRFVLDTTKQYTLKLNNSNNNINTYIRSYTDNTYSTEKTRILQDGGGNINKTFTPDSAYVEIYFLNSSAVSNIEISYIQLELGSATTYEPYGTNQWCKYNAIGKVNLQDYSTLGWWKSGSSVKASWEVLSSMPMPLTPSSTNVVGLAICNYFQNGTAQSIWDGSRTPGFGLGPDALYFGNSYSTANDFKTFIANNQVFVYYVLATPYLSLIEDNNLIEQLDNIQNAMSYQGTTNISQVNNDKPFIISVKAVEDGTNEVVVNNIGNAYSKPLIALEGSGNVDIYLDNTQILKANVEDKMNIDIAKLEAYNPDTSALLNRQVIGNYNTMTLQPGENTIRIDGALDKATISNYTRWL